MNYIMYFMCWTFCLYYIHRIAHKNSLLMKYHADHHRFVNEYLKHKNNMSWHWNNLFLVNDNLKSTIDLWLTEVIPTIVFCILTQQWWIFAVYYLWASVFQESLEHNSSINIYPFMTCGSWHLAHHKNPTKNFCLFFPIWDILLKTNSNE